MTSSAATCDVAVIVVTYNSERLLPDFLSSLDEAMQDIARWQLVIVDNASADASVATARQLAPDAHVLALACNRGYAAGLNAGLRAVPDADSYLFLNPDARLRRGCAHALVRCLATAGTGIAVPRLHDEHGRMLPSLRREPTLARAAGEAVLGGRRAGAHPRLGELITDAAAYEQTRVVDWATGAVMLVSAACLAAVGQWDESFFLYSEETDFALRARDAGFATRYCPGGAALHIGGEVHASPRLYAILTLNRLRLFRRRHQRGEAVLYWCCLAVNELARCGDRVHRRALRALLRPHAGIELLSR